MKRRLQLSEWLRTKRHHVLLLFMSAIPVFLTHPGWMSADTKIYLYTDPGKLLSRAVSLWDTHVGLGTVTHQNLGYLFPMGPYYWLMDRLRVPDWIALRFWWTGLLFVAALGARALSRRIGLDQRAAFLAGCLYAFGPYFLHYLSKQSGLLPAWSATPWLILVAMNAVESRGWRWPARFGLIVLCISSLNASTPIFVLLGPTAWLIAELLAGRTSLRRVLITGLKCGVTSFLLCYWWIAGLSVQGGYGLPILRFTETYEAIMKTALPQEILRGLGYWFFYGDDRMGRWVEAAGAFMTNPFVLICSFSVVALSLVGVMWIKHPYRLHVILLMIVGLGVSVGGAPQDSPGPYGWLFQRFTETDAGLAMRSTPRAAPLLLMGMAIGFATAYVWFRDRFTGKQRLATHVVAATLIAVNGFPLLTGDLITSMYRYKEVPDYWNAITAELDPEQDRVYEFPGTDFPNYLWGGTVDPVSPGLTDASIIARELVPLGSEPTANLLNALESRLQNGSYEPSMIDGFARLVDANKLLLRNDLNYRKYRTPRADQVWWELSNAGWNPIFVGPDLKPEQMNLIIDGQSMTQPRSPKAPTVALFDSDSSFAMASASTAEPGATAVVFGDGSGLIDIASLDLIGEGSTWLYDVSTPDPAKDTATRFFLTDSNRRQARHWYSVGFNVGRTERADEVPKEDPSDSRLEPFASASSDTQSVSQLVGDIEAIDSSWHGNRISFTNEDRPENAFDGDPRTAWRSAVFRPSKGEYLQMQFRNAITTDQIRLVQPQVGAANRKITRIEIQFDNANAQVFELDKSSYQESGQVIEFPTATFSQLRITVLEDSFGIRPSYAGVEGIGFAEIDIPGITSAEYIRLPLAAAENIQADASWTVVLSRDRIMQSISNFFDPEINIQRIFEVPISLAPDMRITARLSGMAEDPAIADALGYPLRVRASRHLYGSFKNAGLNTMDGDLDTAWTAARSPETNAFLTFKTESVATRRMRIYVVKDANHSTPSRLLLKSATGSTEEIDVQFDDNFVDIELPENFGTLRSLMVTDTDPVFVEDYFSGEPIEMPVALAEVILNDTPNLPYKQQTRCRDDLLTIDGQSISLEVPVLDANHLYNRQPFDLVLCGPVPDLDAGEHVLRTSKGWDTGIDIDRIAIGDLAPVEGTTPQLLVDRKNDTSYTVTVPANSGNTIVSLNQSINDGWQASSTASSTYGQSFIVNGYANGWLIPDSPTETVLSITWTPQSRVNRALLISFGAFVLMFFLALRRPRQVAPHLKKKQGLISIVLVGFLLIFFGSWGAALGVSAAIIAMRPQRLRHIGAVVPGIAISAVACGVLYKQFRYEIPASMDWPNHFLALVPVTWFAFAFACMFGVLNTTIHTDETD